MTRPGKIPLRDSNSEPSAFGKDALTTRPTRQLSLCRICTVSGRIVSTRVPLDVRQANLCETRSSRNSPLFVSADRLVGLVVKASASRAVDLGFESRLRQDFSWVEAYQWPKNWHSSGYHARRLALQGQCWDWLVRCQYTVAGWDG